MKITFNIQKKHLTILLVFLLVIGIGIVLGTSYPLTNPPSHDQLWTKEIYGKGVNAITVYDNIDLINNKHILYNGQDIIGPGGGGTDCIALPPSIDTAPSGYALAYKRIAGILEGKQTCKEQYCPKSLPSCTDYFRWNWISVSLTNYCYTACRVATTTDFDTIGCPLACTTGTCSVFTETDIISSDYNLYCK